MFDEEIKKPKGHEVGMPIDTMSIEELNERIALLEDEISRLKAAINDRGLARIESSRQSRGPTGVASRSRLRYRNG